MAERKKSDLEVRAGKIKDSSKRLSYIISELESLVTGIFVPAEAARQGREFKVALGKFCESLRKFV